MTSPRDIRWFIQQHFDASLVEEAGEWLSRSIPHYALKRQHDNKGSKSNLWLILSALILAALFPITSLHIVLVISSIFFLAMIVFKVLLVFVGKRSRSHIYRIADVPMPSDHDLPIYTLLIPLFKEAASVPYLLDSLKKLDYPKHKLDIKLITESGDDETIQAVKHAAPPGYFHLITVPRSQPQTQTEGL